MKRAMAALDALCAAFEAGAETGSVEWSDLEAAWGGAKAPGVKDLRTMAAAGFPVGAVVRLHPKFLRRMEGAQNVPDYGVVVGALPYALQVQWSDNPAGHFAPVLPSRLEVVT